MLSKEGTIRLLQNPSSQSVEDMSENRSDEYEKQLKDKEVELIRRRDEREERLKQELQEINQAQKVSFVAVFESIMGQARRLRSSKKNTRINKNCSICSIR